MFRFALLSLSVLLAPTARAGDDLDDLLNDDEEEDGMPTPAPTGPADDLGPKDPVDVDPDAKDAEGTDLLGDETEAVGVAGADTAEIYRKAQESTKSMSSEEEVAFWEQYLGSYPNTQFRDRVQSRIDALMGELYGRKVPTGEEPGDAMDQELHFTQGLLISNIDPRTRLQAGLEWGNPDWINLHADYEHQLARTLSIHGGMYHRYAGWSVEVGPRWALVKSTRTKTVVSLLGDALFNTSPAFPAFRPQIGVGKRFGEKLDVQLQGGAALEFRSGVQLVALGGANVTYRVTDTVAVFGETGFNAKNFGWDDGKTFRFQTATLGLRFFPLAGDQRDDLDVNLAGTAPYSTQYWQYHFGAIMAQANYWMD